MIRQFLIFAALFARASSVVYTCNEIRNFLSTGAEIIGESTACVVIPATASMTEEPYASYIQTTYVLDSDSGMKYEFKDLDESRTFCMRGLGPWFVESDATTVMECSSEKYQYAEIMLIFTSDEPNIVQVGTMPKTDKYGKGTHVFVAPEGSLMVEKNSIDEGKETTLQWYTGAGKDESEERFAMMPEKFVAGTSTIVIGPVTTLIVEDDVSVELALTSFQEKQFISATPGFSFSLMSTGRANDMQSTRPSILISTAYGINDDSIAYDSISITGTVKMDENVATSLTIDCYNQEVGHAASDNINSTRDITINDECTSLDITYQGTLDPERIYRSSEVIYLRIESNTDPVHKQTTEDKPATKPPPPTTTPATRRTMPPTSTRTTSMSSTSRNPSSTTKKPDVTTTSASGISLVTALVVGLLRLL